MGMEGLEVLPPEDIRAEEWTRPFDMNRGPFPQPSSPSFARSTAPPPGSVW
jgi:hypothetical protein